MKKDDVTLLIAVVIVAATVAFIISSSIFKYSSTANAVPQVEKVDSVLPDAYNDSTYKAIFNSNAVDPTQLTQIGNQNNASPFRGTQ